MSEWRGNLGVVCIVSGSILFFGGAILGGHTVPVPGSHDTFEPYLLQGILLQAWGVSLFFVGLIVFATFREQAVAPRTYRRLRAGGIACIGIGLLLIAVAVFALYYYLPPGGCETCTIVYPYQGGALWTAVLSSMVLVPGIILLVTSWKPSPMRQRRPG